MDDLTRLKAADDQWTRDQERANASREALFDACADAMRAGHTASDIESLIRQNKTPEQLEAGLSFTAAYIRRKARMREVPPMPPGPKRRTQPTAD